MVQQSVEGMERLGSPQNEERLNSRWCGCATVGERENRLADMKTA